MTRNDLDNKDILTVDDVATYLSISKGYAYELVHQEQFRVINLANSSKKKSCIRIPKQSFLDWVDGKQ